MAGKTGTLIALFVVLLLGGLFIGGQVVGQPAPTPTLSPTATAPPTATTPPTATALPPTATPQPTLSAADILARAQQAQQDPQVFGLHSYTATTVTYGDGGPTQGILANGQVWFAAPAHKRVENMQVAQGSPLITFVIDGQRAWQYLPDMVTIVDPTWEFGPTIPALVLTDAVASLVGNDQVAGRPAYILDLTGHAMSRWNVSDSIQERVWFDAETFVQLRAEVRDAANKVLDAWIFTAYAPNVPIDPARLAFTITDYDRISVYGKGTEADEMLLWQRMARTVDYSLFRPATMPAGFNAASAPNKYTFDDWVSASYGAVTKGIFSNISLMELPAPKADLPNGELVQVGAMQGSYSQPFANLRRLAVRLDSTEIWITGMDDVTRDDLIAVAASLQPVVDPNAATPPTPKTVGPIANINDIGFVDPLHGWLIGITCWELPGCLPLLRTTADGGDSWQATAPLPAGTKGVSFRTPLDGWAFGQGIYVTHDGGASWTAQLQDVEITSFALKPTAIWVVAGICRPGVAQTYACANQLLISRDDGQSWTPTATQPNLGANGTGHLTALNENDAWLISWREPASPGLPVAGMQATHNGGASWQEIALPGYCADTYLAARAVDDLWLACPGDPGAGNQEKALYRSSDGGQNWRLVAAEDHFTNTFNMPSGYVAGLAVTGPDTAWMPFNRNGFYVSRDGGQSWQVVNGIGDDGLGPLAFVDAQHGWTVSYERMLYRTTDGENWTQLPQP